MAPFSWPVQAIGWLPEAVRPGVFVALVVLLIWLVVRAPGSLWRALCRGVARLLDIAVGFLLRPEYAITTARRRRGEAPPRWAFALAHVTDGVEDGAVWLYERHQPPAAEPVEDDEEAEPVADEERSTRGRTPVLVACTVILVGCTAAWITMDRLTPTSIAKYELAEMFGPWREIEEWAGVDPGRGAQPVLVRTQRHRRLIRARVACHSRERCRGWVLLKKRSGAIVAVRFVELEHGSTLVELRLTRPQLRAARGGRLVAEGV